MPTPRETILAALHARLSALPATALRGEVLPERVPAGGLLILRDGEPGEPEVTLSPLRYHYQHRAEIEDALKAGTLPAVVATSSLELGIDMGAVDLVVQVESPPSVASGLQRVGRAGHQVGAVSRGSFHALHRQDLLETAVVVEQMRSGGIEALRIPVEYLAELFTAGDTAQVTRVLRTLAAMRAYLRDIALDQPRDE